MGKIGVVYATNSTMIRRIIVPEYAGELDPEAGWTSDGETLLITDSVPAGADLVAARQHYRRQVREVTGVDPPELVCAVVDPVTGLVESMIMADPAIDQVKDKELVLAPAGVGIGCSYRDGVFWTAPYTAPPYTDKTTGEEMLEKFYPAEPITAPQG